LLEQARETVDGQEMTTGLSRSKPGLLRVAPFAGACSLVWIAVLVGSSVTWWEYWLSLGLALFAGLVASASIIARRWTWLGVVPSALILLAAIGLMRDSAGGFTSGASALAILPVFQTALYSSSRRDLFTVLAAVAVFFVVPILVVGAPDYPNSQYRAVLFAVAVDAIIGLTTQALVARARRQATDARNRGRMLEQVSQAVYSLFDSHDPRNDACQAARTIGDAATALLYETDADSGRLVCTAMAGIDGTTDEIVADPHGSAGHVLRSGQPVLITQDVEAYVADTELWVAAGRPKTLLYQPLIRGDTHLGVLVVCWASHVRADGPRATVVALLAHEMAAVIARADAMSHLNDEAITDALTGLPNRRAWEARLRAVTKDQKQLSVCVLDLDHFKQFNDSHGHPTGDRLLKETAAAWSDQLRPGDLLARIGGEEFGLLLPDCDPGTASDIVERLRAHVTHGRTCSAGIAVYTPGENPEAAVGRADQALYLAKAQGRDRTHLTVTAASIRPSPARRLDD
jgi:diguanylate cyclase (GGDEF)-like protein